MNITYWSDYACPYCYIGEARLKKALSALGLESSVAFERKAFELDPAAPAQVVSTTPERFARKYGMTIDGAKAQIEHISALGQGEGIEFNYATTQYTNTLDAHRLTKLAAQKGEETAARIEGLLFDSYFTKNERLSDRAVLLRIADEAGLDRAEAEALLSGDHFADEVRLDEREAARYGIHGVPYFLIDGAVAIPGAMDTDSFIGAIRRAEEDSRKRAAEESGAVSCGADGCRIS